MSKIGVSDIPKKTKEYFNDEVHEFLVAIGGGSTSGSCFDQKRWNASVPILGYIDLNTGRQSTSRASMQFVLTDKERESRSYFKYFEKGSIYKVKGLLPKSLGDIKADNEIRMSELYVTDMVSAAEQNDFLQGLINEYNKIVTITSEVFGEMTLDKDLVWYSGTGDWLGEQVEVSLTAPDEEYDITDDLRLMEQFFKDQSEWNKKLREYAAAELTDLANDWLADAVEEGEELLEITEADFARRITIDSIVFDEDGEFTVYFGDDDMFWGHSVVVYGNIENGPNEAQMEG